MCVRPRRDSCRLCWMLTHKGLVTTTLIHSSHEDAWLEWYHGRDMVLVIRLPEGVKFESCFHRAWVARTHYGRASLGQLVASTRHVAKLRDAMGQEGGRRL